MTDPFSPIRIRKIGHVGLYCRDLASACSASRFPTSTKKG